jgi:hypothetical protein
MPPSCDYSPCITPTLADAAMIINFGVKNRVVVL